LKNKAKQASPRLLKPIFWERMSFGSFFPSLFAFFGLKKSKNTGKLCPKKGVCMKECVNWQNFIQTIVARYAQGYGLVYGFRLPDRKKDQWDNFISKIDDAYNANFTKSQRQKQRLKGYKSFLSAHWQEFVVVQATSEGKFPDTIPLHVQSLFKPKYSIQVGNLIELEIREVFNKSKKHVTVFLTTETVKKLKNNIRAMLSIHDDIKKQQQLRNFFAFLNKLPRYSGLMQQIHDLFLFTKNRQHSVVTKIKVKRYKQNKKTNKIVKITW
jgi:hypothetical protein